MNTFQYAEGSDLLGYLYHKHNCGWEGDRRTERTVEVPIADLWINRVAQLLHHTSPYQVPIWEVGAVTPYYWPGRVQRVIDPYDEHPDVTDRTSLFAINFDHQAVLSISTLEHVEPDKFYDGSGFPPPTQAFLKLASEASLLLITTPFGQNGALDQALFLGDYQWEGLTIRYMVREEDESWRPATREEAIERPYKRWANAIALTEKGGLLGW